MMATRSPASTPSSRSPSAAAALPLDPDGPLPLVEPVAVALGHAADLRHHPLLEAELLSDLPVGEPGPALARRQVLVAVALKGVRQLQDLVLVAAVERGINRKERHGAPPYFFVRYSAPTGQTRMHSKHWAWLWPA